MSRSDLDEGLDDLLLVESQAQFASNARSNLRNIVFIALDNASDVSNETLSELSALIESDDLNIDLQGELTQGSLGMVTKLLDEGPLVNDMYKLLTSGAPFEDFSARLKAACIATFPHQLAPSDDDMLLATRILDFSFRRALPPPRYISNQALDRMIGTMDHEPPRPVASSFNSHQQQRQQQQRQQRPSNELDVVLSAGSSTLVRRPVVSSRGSSRSSPNSHTSRGLSRGSSTRRTPARTGQASGLRSPQDMPSTPPTSTAPSDLEATPSVNKRLPPVPDESLPRPSNPFATSLGSSSLAAAAEPAPATTLLPASPSFAENVFVSSPTSTAPLATLATVSVRSTTSEVTPATTIHIPQPTSIASLVGGASPVEGTGVQDTIVEDHTTDEGQNVVAAEGSTVPEEGFDVAVGGQDDMIAEGGSVAREEDEVREAEIEADVVGEESNGVEEGEEEGGLAVVGVEENVVGEVEEEGEVEMEEGETDVVREEKPTTEASTATPEKEGKPSDQHPHSGPCQFTLRPLLVHANARCGLCSSVTGGSGLPCPEQDIEFVLAGTFQEERRGRRLRNAAHDFVCRVAALLVAELIITLVKKSLL